MSRHRCPWRRYVPTLNNDSFRIDKNLPFRPKIREKRTTKHGHDTSLMEFDSRRKTQAVGNMIFQDKKLKNFNISSMFHSFSKKRIFENRTCSNKNIRDLSKTHVSSEKRFLACRKKRKQ
jgi:hypothetical protein